MPWSPRPFPTGAPTIEGPVGHPTTPRLPDWLILGAPKAGTTTLADWLRQHPDAFVSADKEPGFFDAAFDRGLAWYASHFVDAGVHQQVGEATPAYLYYDDALDRIATTLPDVRLAVILREPVSRAWSHLWYFRMLALEMRDPAEVLETELRDPSTAIDGLEFGYLHMSRYVDRLEAVARRFGRDRLLVLFTDDLRADPDGSYARLCSHIGIAPVPAPAVTANTGGVPRSLRLQRLILRAGVALPSTRVKKRVVRALMRANRREGYPSIPADLEQRLHAAFVADNDRLAAWLGRQLPPRWSCSAH